MEETRVVLADDHPLFLTALETMLTAAGVDVVATAENGAEALELVAALGPDALLLDLRMPGMEGLACLERVVAGHPDVKVVILSSVEDPDVISRALAAGAACFVSKSVEADEILHALRIVTDACAVHFRGELVQPCASARRGPHDTHGLTRRELEILRLVSDGTSNAAMARQLWVTEQTIKFHLSNVYRKLDVPNRTAASAKANELGLLEDEPGTVLALAPARTA